MIDNIKLQTVDILTRIEYMRRLKKKGTLRNKILKQKLAQLVGGTYLAIPIEPFTSS